MEQDLLTSHDMGKATMRLLNESNQEPEDGTAVFVRPNEFRGNLRRLGREVQFVLPTDGIPPTIRLVFSPSKASSEWHVGTGTVDP